MKKIFLIVAMLFPLFMVGQNSRYESLLTEQQLHKYLSYFSDDQTEGRATGSRGKFYAEQYIVDNFKQNGLKPFNWGYTDSFVLDTVVVRNVVGVVPAVGISDEYIVISAHYDHLGILNNKIYNGADDNASGVAALLSLAELFSKMRADGVGPHCNLLFVAFDGKELDMAGSKYFVENYPGDINKIVCNINLDILGSTLVPVHKGLENYMIVLGEETLPQKYQGILAAINSTRRIVTDLNYSFYGSRDFTTMMYELGDHYSFAQKGIPALYFTSAFTDYTYKPTDDIELINFAVLRNRVLLIYNFISRISER
ncbi:MAG: M28 family peptidase [Bacteroidales bacterium]|nr:M28 family peptidase [Bacteroidales bacterium]